MALDRLQTPSALTNSSKLGRSSRGRRCAFVLLALLFSAPAFVASHAAEAAHPATTNGHASNVDARAKAIVPGKLLPGGPGIPAHHGLPSLPNPSPQHHVTTVTPKSAVKQSFVEPLGRPPGLGGLQPLSGTGLPKPKPQIGLVRPASKPNPSINGTSLTGKK